MQPGQLLGGPTRPLLLSLRALLRVVQHLRLHPAKHTHTSETTSVADPDPGSVHFLALDPGLVFFRIPDSDPGSSTPISESIVIIFWGKSKLIRSFSVPVQKQNNL